MCLTALGLSLAAAHDMTLQRVISGAGVALVVFGSSAWEARADPLELGGDGRWLPRLRAPYEMARDQPAHHSLLANALGVRSEPGSQRVEIDMQPALDGITGFLQSHGFPLHEDSDLTGDGGIAFSATMRVNDELPSVYFNVGDHGPLDAFYANEGGFRFALKWPLMFAPQFALHLGGGEDSEFGNWAILGLQWLDSKRPLAIGLGMPVALKNANGGVGLIFQLRMLLN